MKYVKQTAAGNPRVDSDSDGVFDRVDAKVPV